MDQSANRPDICLGADEYHTSDGLLDLAHDVLVSSGYSVAVNTPFSGCLLPMSSYQKTKRVQELMIEVNRGSRVEPLQSQRKGSTHTAA